MWGITGNSLGSCANPGAIYPGYWGLSGAHQAPEGPDRTPGSRYKSGMRTVILRLGDREVQALGKTPEFWRAVVRKNVRSLPRSKFWARRSPLSKGSSRIGGMRQAITGDRAQRRLRQRQPQDPRIEWSDSGLPPIHFCLASEQTTSVRSPATSRKNWTRHAARWRLISSVWTDSCALHLRTDADVTTLVMQVAQRGRPQAWPGGKRQRARPR